MKKTAFLLALLMVTQLALSSIYPQNNKSSVYIAPLNRPPAPADFFGKPEEYLDWQAQNILDLVQDVLFRFPPQLLEPYERHMAMWMLDAVFHDVKAPERPSVQEFFHSRTELALKEIESTFVDEGAKIWKLYNMGYIVRTPTVTLGFDLIRGNFVHAEGFPLDDELMARLIEQCDALFISHLHGDHAELWIARQFIDSGKPVVAPPDLWADEPIFKSITHLKRETSLIQTLPIQSGKRELKVIIFPGHQGTKALNNVSLVISPEGLSFCHTGDQSYEEDFAWVDHVGENFWIDILMPNCWARNPSRTARGYNPELTIPGHQDELGHSIDHREAYGLDYSRWQVPYPKLIMAWGESYTYFRKK